MSLSRRNLMAALFGATTLAGSSQATALAADPPSKGPRLGQARPFSIARLKARAAELSRRPYVAPVGPPQDLVRAIDYDAFGRIAYRPSASLWGDLSGDSAIRFFPVGRAASHPVSIFAVEAGRARPVLFDPALFDMPADSPLRKITEGLGFSGFRAMNPDGQGDWIAYLGASYFRSADPFNQYGLSARGLALDTATPKAEEFPAFTSFWLERDAGGNLIVNALLDGPSVAGAYRIAHHRSKAGLIQEIEVELHFRAPVQRLGLAPLTSMYWYDQTDRTPADDWRPQIHDSDGLAIWTGAGERVWRPLANPPRVMTNLFLDKTPRGFGLIQRDRRFEDYQDDGIFYDRRPSAWVEPLGDWGEGSVQLVELPTTGEADDNIVAFWTPAAPVVAGQTLAYRYRLHWTDGAPSEGDLAKVVATRSGQGGRPGQPIPPGRRKFVVDFEGGALAGLDRGAGVESLVECHPGAVIEATAYPVVGTHRWRLMFDVDLSGPGVKPGSAIDLRAVLRQGHNVLTETWIHQAFAA
ncbi:MAG: glucan biosynthesis protein D [Caulobacteraceae bacterium]|nr:glucan biosynthesis protein D [Caulobacteraceae bacterium]